MAHPRGDDEQHLTDPETEEDSEDESLFDEGPGDGYSQPRNHPQAHFVEKSSIAAEAEGKARESNEQRASDSAAAASQLSSIASSPRSIAWTMPMTEHSTEAPPPTYESIAQGNAGISQAHPTHYGSITTPVYSHFVVPSHGPDAQPQSMSDSAPPPVHEESGLLAGSRRKRGSNWRRSVLDCFKPLSICNIVLIVAIIMIISLVAGVTSDDTGNGAGREGGGEDNRPTSPPVSPSPPPYPGTPSRKTCNLSNVANSLQLDFENLSNFTFLELMESSTHFNGGIDGHIEILPASAPQDSDIRVWVMYATSDPWHIQHSDYVQTHDSLTLQLPSLVKASDESHPRPCLGVYVRIEVKAGLRLDNWELATGNFDVQISDGLFNRNAKEEEHLFHLQVLSSSFTAVHGKIASKYWSSRRTIVETTSGSITGSFALRDLLFIKTQSGTVTVDVDPKTADEEKPSPAEFIAHTNSGTITTHFPTSSLSDSPFDIPVRDYRIHIQTSSASVGGSYILGMQTTFHTQSGSVNAKLLPIIGSTSTDISYLHTSTSSGSQTLTILPPYYLPEGQSYAETRSDHKYISSSGTLKLTYPDEWEGYIEGETESGSVEIIGKGVVKLAGGEGRGWWGNMYRHVVARKGGEDAKGKAKFQTSSGSVHMQMGGYLY